MAFIAIGFHGCRQTEQGVAVARTEHVQELLQGSALASLICGFVATVYAAQMIAFAGHWKLLSRGIWFEFNHRTSVDAGVAAAMRTHGQRLIRTDVFKHLKCRLPCGLVFVLGEHDSLIRI